MSNVLKLGDGLTEDLLSTTYLSKVGDAMELDIVSYSSIPFWERLKYAWNFLFKSSRFVYSVIFFNLDEIKKLKNFLQVNYSDK